MKKLIIANWKMNPQTAREAVKLARAEDRKGVVIAPPFPFIEDVGKILKRAKLGAQDAFWVAQGAYTGEVSPRQLKRARVSYVIVAHSERRALGETDAMVGKKVSAVLTEGLTPVVCVGEPWSVRKKGLAGAKRYVARQLRAALKGISAKRVIVAYEPLWAIGTGKADRPAEAAAMAMFIKHFKVGCVLYGGSVTSKNASAFLRERALAGALVGGASLHPRDFAKIIVATNVPRR